MEQRLFKTLVTWEHFKKRSGQVAKSKPERPTPIMMRNLKRHDSPPITSERDVITFQYILMRMFYSWLLKIREHYSQIKIYPRPNALTFWGITLLLLSLCPNPSSGCLQTRQVHSGWCCLFGSAYYQIPGFISKICPIPFLWLFPSDSVPQSLHHCKLGKSQTPTAMAIRIFHQQNSVQMPGPQSIKTHDE